MEENKGYPSSASQEALFLQDRFSIHRGMCQIPIFITLDEELDIDLLKKAVDLEIERNDALRDRITVDKKTKQVEQRFGGSYRYEDYNGKIEVYDYSGKPKEKQDKLLKKLACQVLEYKKFNLIKVAVFNKTYDNKFGLFVAISHMVCDAWGLMITVSDLFDVYLALKNHTEMPKPLASFEECLAKDIETQTEEKDRLDIDFLVEQDRKIGPIDRMSGVIDKRLPYKKNEGKNAGNTMRNMLRNMFRDKSTNYVKVFPKETLDQWMTFCSENQVSFYSLIHSGLLAYLSRINQNNDIAFDSLCNRRATIADKHSAGCRMNVSHMRIKLEDEEPMTQVFEELTSLQNQFFRHSGLSCLKSGSIETRKKVNSANYYGNAMTSVIMMPYQIPEEWHASFNILSVGHYAQAEYIIVLFDLDGSLKFNVEYQLDRTNKVQVEATVNGIYDAVCAIVSDKTQSFRQIKDAIQ